MSYHSHCVEYTKDFVLCDHRQVSMQQCRSHDRSTPEASIDNTCNPIKFRMTVFRLCGRCRLENPYTDEFNTDLPIRNPDGQVVEDYSLAWLQSTTSLPPSEMPETDDAECGWSPHNDSRATRRSIGVHELENLEILLRHELRENPIPEHPIDTEEAAPSVSRKIVGPRKRPERLPTELPEYRTMARSLVLVHSKPQLFQIDHRPRRDEAKPSAPHEVTDAPDTPVPQAVYKPYRRPADALLSPNPPVVYKPYRRPADALLSPNPPVVYQPYRRPAGAPLAPNTQVAYQPYRRPAEAQPAPNPQAVYQPYRRSANTVSPDDSVTGDDSIRPSATRDFPPLLDAPNTDAPTVMLTPPEDNMF